MSRAFSDDLIACLRFYTRLPIRGGADPHAMPDFASAAHAAPVAGALVGVIGAATLLVARGANMSALVSSACAIAVLVAVTGALHEDGLADVADGFGGGRTRDAKLAIMRDSRLGAYGVVALCLSLILRIAVLAALVEHGSLLAAAALVAAGAVSRSAGLAPMTLPPARGDGVGAAAPRPSGNRLRVAYIVAAIISLLPLAAGASLANVVLADAGAFAAARIVTRLAERQIGGYTGDVLGMAQQACEITVLLCLSAAR